MGLNKQQQQPDADQASFGPNYIVPILCHRPYALEMGVCMARMSHQIRPLSFVPVHADVLSPVGHGESHFLTL